MNDTLSSKLGWLAPAAAKSLFLANAASTTQHADFTGSRLLLHFPRFSSHRPAVTMRKLLSASVAILLLLAIAAFVVVSNRPPRVPANRFLEFRHASTIEKKWMTETPLPENIPLFDRYTIFLSDEPFLTGVDVVNVQKTLDVHGNPAITMEFSNFGFERVEASTVHTVEDYMAVVFDSGISFSSSLSHLPAVMSKSPAWTKRIETSSTNF